MPTHRSRIATVAASAAVIAVLTAGACSSSTPTTTAGSTPAPTAPATSSPGTTPGSTPGSTPGTAKPSGTTPGTAKSGGTTPGTAAGGTTIKNQAKVLQAGTITQEDLPAGTWKSTKRSTKSNGGDEIAKLPECGAVASVQATVDAIPESDRARSDNFTQDPLSANSDVDIFPSAASLTDGVTLYGSEAMASCMKAVLQASADSAKNPVTVDSVTASAHPVPNLGDAAAEVSGQMTVSAGGESKTIGLTIVVVQIGQVALTFTFQTGGTQFPDQEALVNAVTARVTAAMK